MAILDGQTFVTDNNLSGIYDRTAYIARVDRIIAQEMPAYLRELNIDDVGDVTAEQEPTFNAYLNTLIWAILRYPGSAPEQLNNERARIYAEARSALGITPTTRIAGTTATDTSFAQFIDDPLAPTDQGGISASARQELESLVAPWALAGMPQPNEGPQGERGLNGAQGEMGERGERGPKGDKGDKGDTGEQGDQGIQGPKGNDGAEGAPGPKGDDGAPGSQGEQGERGLQGDQGIQGPPGPQGDPGEKGDAGPKGDTGDRGPAGLRGLRGLRGEQGEQGEQGDQGIQGIQGEKGEQGDPGATGATGARGQQGPKGDTGAKGDTGEKGDPGSKGDQGIQGPQGEKGDKGDTGSAGAKGDTGAKGDAGPKGDTGAQGDPGIQGPRGLRGEKGEMGDRGQKGDRGATGLPGATGATGARGPQGPKGDTGDQGLPGERGPAGADGADGLTQAEVDARVVAGTKAPARAGNASRFGRADLPTDVAYDADVPSTADIDARIESEARAGNTDRWDKDKMPDDTVYDADIANFQTLNQVDARVVAGTKSAARSGNTSRFDKDDLPTDVVYDDDITGFQTQSEVDARIATEARAGNTDRWPKAKLPADVNYGEAGHYKGDWASGTVYDVGDVVHYSNKFYIAKTARAVSDTTTPDGDDEWLDITAEGGGGETTGGLTQSQVDTRIEAKVEDYAEVGKTNRVDKARLPRDTVYDADIADLQTQAQVDARIATEARAGNTDTWPASKLPQSSRTQAGIITAAQWLSIENSIDATTLHDQPHLDNSDIDGGVGQDSVLIDDASVTGTASLKEIYFNELDKRWAAVDRANYLGAWVSGGEYRVGDIVVNNDLFYIAKSTRSGANVTTPADDDEWLDITAMGGGENAVNVMNLILTYQALPTANAQSPDNIYVDNDAIYHKRSISNVDTTEIPFTPSAADPFTVASGTFSAQSQIPADIRRYIESIQAVYENTLSQDRTTYNFRRGNWVAYLSPEFTGGTVTLTVGTTNITLQRVPTTTRTHDGRTYTRYQSISNPSQANSAVILTSPYRPRIRLTLNTPVYVYDRVDIGVTEAEVDAKIAPVQAAVTAANRYKGAWVSGTTYRIGDVVVDGNAFFIAKTARTTGNTTAPASDPEWLDMTSAADPQAGMIVTRTEIDWGDDDIAIGVGANNVASGWTTLSTPTINAGAHILTFRLFIQETGQAWYGIEYRIRRTRGAAVTTIEETPRIRYNARPTDLTWTDQGGQYQSITVHFTSQAGDTFELQARGIADNVQNVQRQILFPHEEQHIEMTTMTPAASSAVAIDARIADWAQESNTTPIPAAKVTAANRYKGAWVSGTAYSVGDLVESGNRFYIARLARTSADTTAPASDSEWLEITSQQRSTADIDARIATEARTGNTDRWDKAKVPSDTVYDADIANFQTQTQVDARVVAGTQAPARAGNTARWPKGKLPTDTAYGTIPGNTEIDARIAQFARQGATVNIPDARLPTILRGLPTAFGTAGQILQMNSGATALEFADAASGGSAAEVHQGAIASGTSQSLTSGQVTVGTYTLFTPSAAGTYVIWVGITGNFSSPSTSFSTFARCSFTYILNQGQTNLHSNSYRRLFVFGSNEDHYLLMVREAVVANTAITVTAYAQATGNRGSFSSSGGAYFAYKVA